MINEFANRQNMHLTVLALLDDPAHQPVWQDQRPVLFTTRTLQLRELVAGLTTLISGQQADTTGHAADKRREEDELEDCAYEIGQALADWFEDQGRHADAAPFEISISAWQGLRDAQLLAKAKLLHQKLVEALATHAEEMADYGLDAEEADRLDAEIGDFERLVGTPGAAISSRRALTRALRPRFREVSDLLRKMDRLVIRFRGTEAGRHFADAWAAARIVRDLGQAAAPAA